MYPMLAFHDTSLCTCIFEEVRWLPYGLPAKALCVAIGHRTYVPLAPFVGDVVPVRY